LLLSADACGTAIREDSHAAGRGSLVMMTIMMMMMMS